MVKNNADTPLLLLAVSTRCGSTWVQRTFTSTRRMYVWGEGLELTTRAEGVNTEKTTDEQLRDALARPGLVWQANIRPERMYVVDGLRERCLREFARSAADAGYPSWGLKEVRWTQEGVDLFRAAFPAVRIVPVLRSFDACFASSFKDRPEPYPGAWALMARTWCEHAEAIAHWVIAERGVRLAGVMYHGTTDLAKLVADVAGVEPDYNALTTRLSDTGWQPWQDRRAKSPAQVESCWPWRDRIRGASTALGLETPTL